MMHLAFQPLLQRQFNAWEHNYTIERYWKSCSISMCQPLLQQQFNSWQERHWGCSHCACILYSLSHKHRWWDGDDGNKVAWWWGELVMGWDGDMGCGWRDGMGSGWWWGCLLFIKYRIYSWILPLTPPLNLMWKILKLPDSWSSRSAGCRSRHFYSALQVQPLQHSYSAVWTLLQHPGISTLTALRAPSAWTLLQHPGISTFTALRAPWA